MSDLKKIRVQHVGRDENGLEVKTDVDVLTDASAVTMDGKDLKSGIGDMIDGRIEELIDGAPEELDTLKEIAEELTENKSGVTTILNKLDNKLEAKDLEDYLKTEEFEESRSNLSKEIQESRGLAGTANQNAREAIEISHQALARGAKIRNDYKDHKRCIILTQSEYDALSSTEKNREDTLYFIKG